MTHATAKLNRAGTHPAPVQAPKNLVRHAKSRPGAALGNQATQAILQRKCATCENEAVQRKAEDRQSQHFDGNLEAAVDSLRGRGSPLPESTRNFFETRFGQDFSLVRIHSDSQAAATARSIDALAFTHGRDIAFAQGLYQPDSASGRKLLAHELAHVVQQAQGVRRKSPADSGQGACGEDIGDPPGCSLPTSEPDQEPVDIPIGELIRFQVNCSRFADDAEGARVEELADSMLSTDAVRVHGFASMDGDPGFNQRLSCARALEAVTVLKDNGIADDKIETIAHGPTEGPVEERRSVILELEEGVSREPTPQLLTKMFRRPTPGECGEFWYAIEWVLSRDSHPVNGGFVVQEITTTFTDVDCWGVQIPHKNESPVHFYEAWRVEPGSKTFLKRDTPYDVFKQERDVYMDATGKETMRGVATYYDNVAELPDHMERGNPLTDAGGLRSSREDPKLDGIPSRSIDHWISVTWDCCPDQSFPTEIISYHP